MARVLSQGFVATMQCGTDDPVQIGCVTSFQTPQISRAEIDVTCLESDSKEFRLGLMDPGSITLNFNFDDCDDGQAALIDNLGEDDPCSFVFTLFGGTTISFDALVQDFRLDGSVDAAVTGSATLRLTGRPEWDIVCNSES